MNKDIAAYIKKQKPQQREMLQKVRKIFLESLLESEEKIRWGVITYKGGKFYLAALKNKIHVGFSINGLNEKEIGLFEGTGKTMRHLKINSLKDINEEKLVKLIKMVDKKAVCKPC